VEWSGVEDKRKSEGRDNCCGALLGVGGGGVASLAFFPPFQFLPLEINEQIENAVKVQRVGCYSLLLQPNSRFPPLISSLLLLITQLCSLWTVVLPFVLVTAQNRSASLGDQ